MEIVLKSSEIGSGERFILELSQLTPRILRVVESLTTPERLTVYQNEKMTQVATTDILYLETVDLRVYVYSKEKIYLSKQKLFEIEQLLGERNFLRVNKQTVINFSHITCIEPAKDGKYVAVLSNEERVVISRRYMPKFKEIYAF